MRLIVSPSTLPRRCAAGRALLSLLSLLVLAAGAGTALAAGPRSATPAPGKDSATAATRTATPARNAVAPKVKPAKPATPRQQLKREAEGLALATTTVETITEAQLDVALRVLTGQSDCEFNELVTVLPMDGQPGHFLVGHKGQRYTMVPEETATGAVRLVDRRAGVVWLQIPVKSMLMNSMQGRRMIDACTHAEQRLAATAVAEAGTGLGIVPIATAATAAAAIPEAAATPAVAATPSVAATPPAGETPVAAATPAVDSTPAAVSTLAAPAAPAASMPPATPSGPGTTLTDVAAAPAAAPR